MKKWITLMVLVALMSTMLIPAQATENLLKVDDIELTPGETVYVRLELTQPVVADSMGVTYSYDPAVLKPMKSSSTWTKKATTTQAFDTANKAGVWLNNTAVELEGRVCSLAFQVVTGEENFATQVTVTLVIKNGGSEVGTYTTQVNVYTAGWVAEPEVTEPEVTEPEVTEPEVTEPEVTEPEVTEPEVTEPEVTEPKPTQPEATKPQETQPEATEDSKHPTVDDGHDHDHDHDHEDPDLGDVALPEKGNKLQNALILLGIAAVLGGIGMIYKKKRK